MTAWLRAFREGVDRGPVSVSEILKISETPISEKTKIFVSEIDPEIEDRTTGRNAAARPRVEGEPDPIAEARALGWSVELRPWGLSVDTRGHPTDRDLLDRLFEAMVLTPLPSRWPAMLLADPGEVVLRGELAEIEREASR